MRIFILMFIYGVVVVAAESVWQFPIHFLFLAVVYLAFYQEWRIGLACTIMLAFLLDTISLQPLGFSLLSFGVVFGLIRFFKTKIIFQSAASRFSWIAFLSLIQSSISIGLNRSLNGYGAHIFWTALLDGVIGIFWIPLLCRYGVFTSKQLVEEKDILLKR